MRTFLTATAGLIVGYLVGAFGGGYLLSLLSANVHDKSLEAAMTGAFVTGPIGAVIGFVVTLAWSRRRR